MAGTTPSAEPEAPAKPSIARRLALATFVLATAAAAVWIVAAVLMSGRGFDATDEGYYLLNYRWWSTNQMTFTGAQYIYGPIFQLLGYNIAGLRIVRLITIVAAHAALGWAFMGWLRPRRPAAPATRLWEAAGTAAIVAGAGAVYGWLPLSPGYNDISLLGAVLGAAAVLRAATAVERSAHVPAWLPIALGPVVVLTTLSKWTSSIVTFGLIGAVALVVLAPGGVRAVARFVAWFVVGAVGAVAAVDVLVIPLLPALREMLKINRLVAARTNSPTDLLGMYWDRSLELGVHVVARHGVLLLAAILALVIRGPRWRWPVTALAVVGVAISVYHLFADGALSGGTLALRQYPAGLIALGGAVALVGVSVVATRWRADSPRSSIAHEGARGWALYGMLALLPLAQAMGTGNPLHVMALNAYAAWVALIVAVVTGIEGAPGLARWLTAALAAGAVASTVAVATSGLLVHPYRTGSFGEDTGHVVGAPALSSVMLDQRKAAGYSRLRRLTEPYLEPAGRAIMAFDEMPGVVLLLDGRPVGEAWYAGTDRLRTAHGIKVECGKAHPWWGSRAPLLLFSRDESITETNALKSCGLNFETDYRLLAPKEETMGLSVYVPTSEAVKEPR